MKPIFPKGWRLPKEIEQSILLHSGLHELLALSITCKASSQQILALATTILMRYMNQARKICCKKISDVFIHRPLSIARQLLSGSMFKPGRRIHGKSYPTITVNKNSASELYPWLSLIHI